MAVFDFDRYGLPFAILPRAGSGCVMEVRISPFFVVTFAVTASPSRVIVPISEEWSHP